MPDRRAAAGRGLVYRLGFGLPLMLPLVLLLGACCTEQALGFNPKSVLLFAPPSSRLVPRPARGVPLSASAMPLNRGLPPPLPPPPSSRRSIAPLRAWPTGRDPKSFAKDFPQAAARVSITILATLLTYAAHTNQRCGPVLASAGATLAASLVAPGLGQAVMCGTFSGMSSTAILPSVHWALGAGVLTSVLYEVLIHARNAALGLGGRLGTVAFLAVNGIALLQGIKGVPAASIASWPILSSNLRVALSPAAFGPGTPMSITLGFTALGAVATIALREASDDQPVADPVRAAAVTGLLGGLLVGICGYSELASLSTYGGAFVGMSLPSRLMRGVVPGQRPRRDPPATAAAAKFASILGSFTIAGALAGLLHGLSLQLGWFTTPAGWGGKAGLCAFMGVGLYRGGQRLLSWLTTQRRG